MSSLAHSYKIFLNESLWRSLFSVWSLRNFALGLIAVYSPIYFYTKGYGLEFIFMFLAIQAFFNGLMRLPYAYFIARKHNVKAIFAVCLLMLGVVYAAYAYFIDNKQALLVIAAFDGVLQCALWSSYHYIFSAAQRHKHVGSQVGTMFDGSYLALILAVIIGGFVGQRYGLIINFIIAALVLAFAAFVAIRMKINWPHRPHNIKKEKVKPAHIWRECLAGGVNFIDASVMAILWPLMFIVFGILSIGQVGIIVALSLVIVLFLNIAYGSIADDVDRARTLLDGGILATIFVYMLRVITIGSAATAIVLLVIGQIVRGAVDVSYSTLFYRRLNKAASKIKFIAVYETFTAYILALYFVILFIVASLGLNDQLTLIVAFIIPSILIPLTRLIAPDNFSELK